MSTRKIYALSLELIKGILNNYKCYSKGAHYDKICFYVFMCLFFYFTYIVRVFMQVRGWV